MKQILFSKIIRWCALVGILAVFLGWSLHAVDRHAKQSGHDTLLWSAASECNLMEVKEELKLGANPNAVEGESGTPLQAAEKSLENFRATSKESGTDNKDSSNELIKGCQDVIQALKAAGVRK